LIYEEGTPQQIFDNPRKEKTKAFINRIRSLHLHVKSKDYDLYAMQAEMEAFCEKHVVTKRVTGFVMLIAEEVLGLQPDFSDITLSLTYSEKEGTIELICASSGAPANLLIENPDEDSLGLMLIKGRCSSVDYAYENGKNVLFLKVKAD
jgi:polar amino acid transport system ATP-binding protein